MLKKLFLLFTCLFILLSGGCSSDPEVEVIDLNKVLDILMGILEKPADNSNNVIKDGSKDGAKSEGSDGYVFANLMAISGEEEANQKLSDVETKALLEVTEQKDDSAKRQMFIETFAGQLNEAELVKSPLWVEFDEKGVLNGFADKNSNKKNDSNEKTYFTIQIDADKGRLIASDGTYNRDQEYSYRPGFGMGGFFMGYMLGNMLNRQNNFYRGNPDTKKPDFSKMKMNPPNYHAGAVKTAKERARAAKESRKRSSSVRSKSSSRSFSSGK